MSLSRIIRGFFILIAVEVVLLFLLNVVLAEGLGYNLNVFNWSVVIVTTILTLVMLMGVLKRFKQIEKLMRAVDELVKGNIDVHIDYQFDKMDSANTLAINLTKLRDTLKRMIKDIDNMSLLHSMGKIDRVIDTRTYTGAYADLAKNVSHMGQEYAKMTNDMIRSLNNFASGDFRVELDTYEGDKAALNKSMEALRYNLVTVNKEIATVIDIAKSGDLHHTLEYDIFEGSWRDMTIGLNSLLAEFLRPINEAKEVLKKLSDGDLSAKMVGDYKGDFLDIKHAINDSTSRIQAYISEISTVLAKVAKDNLDTKIESYFYGDFFEIKEDVNNIIKKFNAMLNEIQMASENTSGLSAEISNTSHVVAEGAREQSGYIQALEVSMARVNTQADENSENSYNALQNSDQLKESALEATNQMDNMLLSMESIKQSSEDISGIVKIVEGITLQTNLLAINATVEAARAGEAGKGFAVVSEEVRSLSQRVGNATNEIRKLVEESIERVNQGNDIAKQSDEALREIVEKSVLVAENIELIQKSSKEQVKDILKVSNEVSKIADVVATNSEKTIQLAAASGELDTLAAGLEDMTASFKVRRG